MFGKKCTLCGGKLDSRGICTECGLNNKKTTANYKVNQSSCDGMPMTHVHESAKKGKVHQGRPVQTQPVQTEPVQTRKYMAGQQEKKPRGKKGCGCLVLIIIMIILIFGVAGSLKEVIKSGIFGLKPEVSVQSEDRNPYEFVEEELEATGTFGEYTLNSGEYIVGVHLPAGDYRAEVTDEFDTVQVNDSENGVYLFEYEAREDENYLQDLRLYEGAAVTILSEDTITLKTENAQTTELQGMENPVTATYEIADEDTRTAGTDIEPGVYDLAWKEGYGAVNLVVYDESGEEFTSKSIYLGEDSGNGVICRNVVLPKNTKLTLEKGVKVTLTPSRWIKSTDYFSSYENY